MRPKGTGPLAGIRVADFTWAWAGPYATMILADAGAQVIKVESSKRLNNQRVFPPFPGGVRQGPNSGGWFNAVNRGKYGCTLDLASSPGRQLALQLISISDMVVENFSPGVMDRLGLGYRDVAQRRPDIIYVCLSGFGASGPFRLGSAYGRQLAFAAGLASLTGMPGCAPADCLIPYVDVSGGLAAAVGLLAALHHRQTTGQGQCIDVSELESAVCMGAEGWLEFSLNGRTVPRRGNSDAVFAPHGCYRCKEPDTWITIAVASDEEWRALCRAMGRPDLAGEARFADLLGRQRHGEELGPLIASWTRGQDCWTLTERLQALGVPAAPSMNVEQLLNDSHLRSRGFFVTDSHPITGGRPIIGPSWKLRKTPMRVRLPAPLLGEHNQVVFHELLGLGSEDYRKLLEAGVIS